VAFAGPKRRFGCCRLTQLSYTGKIKIVAAIRRCILATVYLIAKSDFRLY